MAKQKTNPFMKLTPKQNMIVYCLQNGWILITESLDRGCVLCCNPDYQFQFGSRLFGNLLDKGLIEQQQAHPFDYVLSRLGKTIKTKPAEITINYG